MFRLPSWLLRAGALTTLIAALGVLLSLGGAWALHARLEREAQQEFGRLSERTRQEVVRRFTMPLYGLHGAMGAFAASQSIERHEFRAFVESYDLAAAFPGVRGFGFIARTAKAGEAAFVARERADGAPQFVVRELAPGPHADRYVIKFIEPLAGNLAALGLDVGSEPRRRAAIERAITTGVPSLTDPVVLVQDGRRSPGFLLFLPVYLNGTDPVTERQRFDVLVGVLYAPIVASELLHGSRAALSERLDFALLHGDAGTEGAPIYDSTGAAAVAARYEREVALDIVGSRMTLRTRSTPAFEAAIDRSGPVLALAGGLLLTALLAFAAQRNANARARAEARAHGLTIEVDRLATVARCTSDAVALLDPQRRIVWVNDSFVRNTGFTPEESIGRVPSELLRSETSDPVGLARMRATLADGASYRGELHNRRKNGDEYWIDVEIQAQRDDAGRLTGWVAIESDITERRRTAIALAEALRDNEALLGTIRTHAIVSVAGPDGRIVEVNDAFCEISGYRRDELLGQDHRIVSSGTHPPGFWREMWQCIAAGRPWRSQVCNRAKDGSLYWVDSIIAPFVGVDGQIEKYVSLRTDITASRRAAEELAHERERLALILEGTNAGTWEIDLVTGEDLINSAYAEMLGYDVAALRARMAGGFLDLVHPEDRDAVAATRRAHLDGLRPDYEVEFRLPHRDGHWVWVYSRGRVGLRDGQGRALRMAGIHLDITTRKQADQALRASQALLEATGRIAGVGGWTLDLATQALAWTDETCLLHDLPPGQRPSVDQAVDFYEPEARGTLRRVVQQAIDGGDSWDIELPLRTAAGRRIWARNVGRVERIDGRATRLLGAIQDITDRRTMEAELRRGSEVMTNIVENLPCGVSVFDHELRLVASNHKFREILDFPDALFAAPQPNFESFIRHNAERGEYGPGDVDAIVAERVAHARAAATPHRFERVRPDGTPIEVQGAPMPGGGFVTTYIDVSERKRAEREIERQAGLLRGAIDAIDEAFVLYDPDDRLVLCNERYRQVYAGVADLIQPGVRFEDLVRAGALRGDYAAAVGRVEEWVEERVALHQQADSDVLQRLADGRTLRIVERKLPDGHIVGFRIDITKLTRATEAAQEASRAKSQFLANMSHEIRTPMNAILGLLKLLGRTGLSARQADYLGKADGAARSLLGLLNDILDFSKAEAGKMELDPQPFRLDAMLRDLSVIVSTNAAGKGVELLFDIEPGLPRVLLGDAQRLQQVLINLCGNAIKFTPQGEVVLAVRVPARSADAVTLEVSVRDTGIGIAPENHARIFSGFTQAEASTTRRFGGTGLGVAICQRLVALMGGELRLQSALGAGSRFWFTITLPVVEDAPARRARPARALRALIVDDHPTARELLQTMVTSLGWHADLAESGTQALSRLADRHAGYDAVFVDWQMPGLDGWQTCERIRAGALAGVAPLVIMVTAQGREMLEQRSAAEQALIDGFLVKPVTASMLYDAVMDAGGARPAAAAVATAGRRLNGLRLLVAEDNPNNQLVARELLEDEGATIEIAANGALAVAAVRAADPPFDAVLMDLQMPEMDGYTATTLIRRDLGRERLPIVAMTANAMASDRAACLAAGMDEHVGKPFDLDTLVALLQRLTGRAVTASAPVAAPPPAAAVNAIDLPAALGRLGGRRDVYRRLLDNFLDDLAKLPMTLQGLAAAGRVDELRRQAHTIKGLAATLGAAGLARSAAAAERIWSGEPAAAEAHAALQRWLVELEAAVPALRALCDDLQSEAPPAVDDGEPLAEVLQALASHLADADMEALAVLDRLRAAHAGRLGDRFAPLEQAVTQLDFEHALDLCRNLMEARDS